MNYSEKDIERLVNKYADAKKAESYEMSANLAAFCNWLGLMGYGQLASAIRVGHWAYHKVKEFLKRVFG